MLLRFSAFRKADTFSRRFAEGITRRYPPLIANNPEHTVSRARIAEILDHAFSSAQLPGDEGRLGLLGRAKLSSSFKWRLRELGYDEDFIGMASRRLTRAFAGEIT